MADVVDPLAGGYLVEHLTDEIERWAADYVRKIDEMEGALAAIEKRYIQHEIADAAYRYQAENLAPLFVEAVENDVTLGKICGVLREVWGEHRSTARI